MTEQTINPRAILVQAHINYLRGKSTMPDIEIVSICKGKPRKWNTTNGITNNIIDYITYLGGFANRISSAGRKIKSKGKEIYIKGTTKRGTPDIDAVFSGLAMKIEVKNVNTKDSMSDDQNKVKIQLERAGAIYIIAPTFESFYFEFHKIIDERLTNRA